MDLYKYNNVILPRAEWHEEKYPFAYLVKENTEEEVYLLYSSNQPFVWNCDTQLINSPPDSEALIYRYKDYVWDEIGQVEKVWISEVEWNNVDIYDYNSVLYQKGTQEEYYKYVPPTTFVVSKEIDINPILPPIYVKSSDSLEYKIIIRLHSNNNYFPQNLSAIVEYQKEVEENMFITLKKSGTYEQNDQGEVIIKLDKNITKYPDIFSLKITLLGANDWSNIFPIELIIED